MTTPESQDNSAPEPSSVDANRDAAGRTLYEERQTMLGGLWMPEAPAWDELPEPVKERWRTYTDRK